MRMYMRWAETNGYKVSVANLQDGDEAGTAGLIVKCFPWLYASVGLGYGERALLHSFTTHSYENYDSTREVWCRNIDSSYKGVAAEVDLMMKITNSVFISVGCNTVNFKYLDLNAGLGVFF